jgi:hypothetical protein
MNVPTKFKRLHTNPAPLRTLIGRGPCLICVLHLSMIWPAAEESCQTMTQLCIDTQHQRMALHIAVPRSHTLVTLPLSWRLSVSCFLCGLFNNDLPTTEVNVLRADKSLKGGT